MDEAQTGAGPVHGGDDRLGNRHGIAWRRAVDGSLLVSLGSPPMPWSTSMSAPEQKPLPAPVTTIDAHVGIGGRPIERIEIASCGYLGSRH